MSEIDRGSRRLQALGAYGADIGRWPADAASGAREALLSDPGFRRAWEHERELDRRLTTFRGELDRDVAQSGGAGRVRRTVLARVPGPLAAFGWQRIAAAVLVAGMLGGVMDLFLAAELPDSAEVVMLDPLYGLADTELQ